MFKILKTINFQLWDLYQSDLRISTAGETKYIKLGERQYL